MNSPPPASDRDLTSIGEARDRARRAKTAQTRLESLTQQQVDTIVDAMADAATAEAEPLAALAVQETGLGVVADKVQKNLFASRTVHEFIRPMKTVGVVNSIQERRVIEIAQPFGVVAGVVPSTNPTSTTIYKILIAIKARCALVISPHPAAIDCIRRTADLMNRAGLSAGLPKDSITWMDTVTLEGTQELMSHRDVALILATGGMGLVRAAYSAGKPAYGVGPGNAPAYIERSADLSKAVRDIIAGKSFDNGLLCSSENSVVVDRSVADDVKREFENHGGRFLSAVESNSLAEVLITEKGLPNPSLVGRNAGEIAAAAGLSVPSDTRVLLAPLDGVGREYPLSIEKLCPVLSFYEVADWREGCERCVEILRYGGMGHTMSIHSQDENVILEFGLKKPAFRIVVNTPTTFGSIGMTTGLDPAMTLGCGGYGGNITSDNISPQHLLNIKRLAYEISPQSSLKNTQTTQTVSPVVETSGVDPLVLADRVETFLSGKGITPQTAPIKTHNSLDISTDDLQPTSAESRPASQVKEEVTDFVCEDDVRVAINAGRSIAIDEKTIVTPAARDMADQHKIFIYAGLSTRR